MGAYGFLSVGFGAAFGAWLRWWLGLRFNPLFPTLPLGTLTANLLGGYLVGVAVAFFARNTALPVEARLFVVTGFMGGLTTFSTFSAEVVTLVGQREYLWALGAASLHLFGSLVLTALGILTVTLAYQWLSPAIDKAEGPPHRAEPAATAGEGATISPCPFCQTDSAVLGNALAYARFDRNPVSPGHLLILPRRHVATWFDASRDEQHAMLALLDEAKDLLDARHGPDGYNFGANVGEAAGQTVMHLHLHLIPRYRGDVEQPRGGVRGVIPTRQNY
jgi:fluoride exporter